MGDWPVALRITADLVLHSDVPNCLCWVPEMNTIYNDAFVPLLGEKAACLGQPFSQTGAGSGKRSARLPSAPQPGSRSLYATMTCRSNAARPRSPLVHRSL